ncbi:MAG: sensor histidine kinase [Actinomycetes bacterium]
MPLLPGVALAAVLLGLSAVGASATFEGDAGVHASLELVAAALSLLVGVTFLVRAVALGARVEAAVGLAFAAAGTVDLVHGLLPLVLIASDASAWTGVVDRVVPATYAVGRLLLGVGLLLVPRVARDDGPPPTWSGVLRAGVLGSAGSFLLVMLVSVLPAGVASGGPVPRPVDALLGVVLLAAAPVLHRAGRQFGDALLTWVAVAAGVAGLAELVIGMSSAVFDEAFRVAHLWKALSVVIPLLGLALWQVPVVRERDLARSERDVADQLREEAQRVPAELVSVLSHELRTPLTVIVGHADTLMAAWDDLDDEVRRNAVAAVQRQGVRLAAMVEDLLLASRLLTGREVRAPARVDLAAVCREAVETLDGEVRLEVSGPNVVATDPHHVARTIAALAENGLRHGEPPVTARVSVEDGVLTIAVHDAGRGLDGEHVDAVTGPFWRARNGTVDRIAGVGLGLTIVAGIADLHGGTVEHHGDATGTTVTVRLPVG